MKIDYKKIIEKVLLPKNIYKFEDITMINKYLKISYSVNV